MELANKTMVVDNKMVICFDYSVDMSFINELHGAILDVLMHTDLESYPHLNDRLPCLFRLLKAMGDVNGVYSSCYENCDSSVVGPSKNIIIAPRGMVVNNDK